MVKFGPFTKLGTVWWFEFFDVSETQAALFFPRLVAEMDRFESVYSRFISTSLVSTLNDTGRLDAPSEEMLTLLRIGENAYRDTGGVFNMAVGGYLESIGYDADYSFRSQSQIVPIPRLGDVLLIQERSVILKEGARLDFGGFGKGFLIDRLAMLMQYEGWSRHFLINGGGDMYMTSDNGEPITISLAHPLDQSSIGSLALHDCGFAASSPYVRRWKDREGNEQHHLVGSHDAHAVYIVAPSALTADIWATTLSIDSQKVAPENVAFFMWNAEEGIIRMPLVRTQH